MYDAAWNNSTSFVVDVHFIAETKQPLVAHLDLNILIRFRIKEKSYLITSSAPSSAIFPISSTNSDEEFVASDAFT